MKFSLLFVTVLLLLGLLLSSFSSSAQKREISYGGIEFERSCAICHGFDGKGNGVMSDSLKIQPSDLTVLSKNNHGHFPFTKVYQVIEGSKNVGIHGTREMPVWGDRYRKEAKLYDADEYLYTRGLILELLMYITHIQE